MLAAEVKSVHVLARITFKPDSASAGRDILARLAAETRREPGCLAYEVFQQAGSPHIFQTVEEWRDAAAVDAHMKTPHIAAAFGAAGPLLAGPPEILPYEAIG